MTRCLDNRVAVITGSGAGIGRVTALAMAKQGAKVVVSDIVAENAEKVAGEIMGFGGEAFPFAGDISSFNVAEKLMQAAADKFGRIDILHNNAGISFVCPIQEFPEKEWDRVIAVNLKGHFNCIRHAAPHMIKQNWGRILNASSAARRGSLNSAAYSATKAAIVGLTGSTARDLAPYGITCNAYLPTASKTGLSPDRDQKTLDWLKKAYEAGQFSKEQYEAISSPPKTEKIPLMLMYLCTEEAANITGQVFGIAGDTISVFEESSQKTTIFKADGWTVDDLKAKFQKTLMSTLP